MMDTPPFLFYNLLIEWEFRRLGMEMGRCDFGVCRDENGFVGGVFGFGRWWFGVGRGVLEVGRGVLEMGRMLLGFGRVVLGFGRGLFGVRRPRTPC